MSRCSWPDLREAGLAVERGGWDSLWVDDHLLADEGDPDDPKLEVIFVFRHPFDYESIERIDEVRGILGD